jgi:broad specificity phosphatase PhoE
VIILVRHGRTEANAGGLLLGRLDPPLDELGTRQAAAVGAALAPRLAGSGAPVRIISSPLARTRATAAAIAASLTTSQPAGDPVITPAVGRVVDPVVEPAVEVDERWIELDYGEYDGMPLGEVPASVWSSWRADPGYAPPGGESLLDLAARVRSSLGELVDEARERDIVVVSHVSPIKAAVAWTLGVGEEVTWRMFLAPASITQVAIGPVGPSLHGFNAVGHLPN